MLQKITDVVGLTLAAMLLLLPTIVFFISIFAIAEALLWCMLYFTQ